MNEAAERFIRNGWAVLEGHVDDDVIAKAWASAVESYQQARGSPPRLKLLLGYDAGRIAAHAIVRARSLRVRATNHHEVTFQLAAVLTNPELGTLLKRMDGMRRYRNEVEYFFESEMRAGRADEVLESVRRMLPLVAEDLRTERPGLVDRIQLPL
jgi:hypothetical protein